MRASTTPLAGLPYIDQVMLLTSRLSPLHLPPLDCLLPPLTSHRLPLTWFLSPLICHQVGKKMKETRWLAGQLATELVAAHPQARAWVDKRVQQFGYIAKVDFY